MSVQTVIETTSTQEQSERLTGKVKWFNNKSGFGFVTACEGELKGKDVFVHYSAINVPEEQYKYLVQGEYVDFDLSDSEKSDHEFHAVNVSGIKGGELMCETRRHISEARPYKPKTYKTPDERTDTEPRKRPTHRTNAVNDKKDVDGFVKIPVRRTKTGASAPK